MKNKKIILSSLLLLLVLISISAASAADLSENNNDIVLEEGNNIALDDDTLNTKANENILKDEDSSVSTIVPETDDGEGLKKAILSAKNGDIISLKENTTYDIGKTKINVTIRNLTIHGNGAIINVDGEGQNGSGSVFDLLERQISIDGIIFNNTNGAKSYGEDIQGYAINIKGINETINNCSFLNFRAGIGADGGAQYSTISNCYFNGSAIKVTNTGHQESGTKAINILGSHHIRIENNTFVGQILDGVSMATGSGNNMIINNTFIENCYAIYFGGASTKSTVIANNTFIRCGWCKDKNGDYLFKNLPVISTQKSADGFVVDSNIFYATNESIIITSESGNTAHGYPSEIGNITITNNTILMAEGHVPNGVEFVYIYSNNGELTPYADITITHNTIDSGIKAVTVWYADWGIKDSNYIVIPKANLVKTSLKIADIATFYGKIRISLEDVNGEGISNAKISYMINNGDVKTILTDSDGSAIIYVDEDGIVDFVYEGDGNYDESFASINFSNTANAKKASYILAENANLTAPTLPAARTGEYFSYKITDENGNPLINKNLKIGFNGHVYNATSDENGEARTQINLKAGGYTFAVCFLGDDDYEPSFEAAKVTVIKQTGSLTVASKSYKASAKTKTLTATFKDAKGNLVSGKSLSFTVNGKTYTAKTNKNGIASVNVSLSAKKTYSFTVKFAGDEIFNGMTKTGKVTIK